MNATGSSAGRAVRIYRAKKLTILLFFVAYSVVQCAGKVQSPRGEYFPVFGWSLFSEVVSPRWTVETEIVRIGDTVFPEPVNFFELGEHFKAARARSSNVRKVAVKFLNLRQEEPAAAEAMRRVFERTYLGDRQAVEYRLVLVTFDPIERWRTGAVLERRVLAQLKTDERR